MAEFAYNNPKNASISHIPFESNCGYYPGVSFEDEIDLSLRSCFINKLTKDLLLELTPCIKVTEENL